MFPYARDDPPRPALFSSLFSIGGDGGGVASSYDV